MQIAVVGTGYVGLVSAACFAELGHTVIGVDIDDAKVEMLKQGKSPIFEPGLEELIERGLKSGLLTFTTKLEDAIPNTKIIFSAVATPPGENHAADLRAVFAVTEAVAKAATSDIVFVNKSTVPVGTGKKCEEKIAVILKERGVNVKMPVVSNPEFLREGMAVGDTLMPDRIVVGINNEERTMDNGQQHSLSDVRSPLSARDLMEELYRPITRVGKPIVWMNRESAEIVKYASNAFLATKISFINMLTEFAENTGANIRDIAKGMGLDDRIGPRFLHAGIGYGGSCFPKDVKALLATAKEHNLDFAIVAATDQINARARARFIEKVLKALPAKATVGVWGLAFKPKTDDMREAPSIDVIKALIDAGHTVKGFDPAAMETSKKVLPSAMQWVDSPMNAAKDADALLVLTEWDAFRGADLKELAKIMRGKDVFDGRNIYEPSEAAAAGLVYHGVGL